MSKSTRLLSISFSISIILTSISYAYTYNKLWSNTNDKYYTMNSTFMAESKNAFSYANATWNNVSGRKFPIYRSSNNSVTDYNKNGINEVFKKSIGTSGSGLMNTRSYLNASKKVIEFDILVNTSFSWANNGDKNVYDVQNCATHEIGHALFAGEQSGSGTLDLTMYYGAEIGETKKRTLESADSSAWTNTASNY